MLGDLVGVESGRTTVQRVVASDHGLPPAVETSFEADGQLLGVPVHDLGSYTARLRADGTLSGLGQGVLMSPTGAHASWTGLGVGRFAEGGGTSWRGVIVYESASPEFADLRGVAGAFEWDVEADGSAHGKLWAWK
ncbi:hypothetical protein AB0D08_24500 [Kitasatospora sp. NPDC048540]|uniref:hypothetical protein n=1 Tax=unclassified Kitasatospora TaxID=2633591 RepID=UPI00053B4201|nr:hypothetical protein [Kitasatospora sp. MBT63]